MPKIGLFIDEGGPWERAIGMSVVSTPAQVPLFPITCDCGIELHDLDEVAAHECPMEEGAAMSNERSTDKTSDAIDEAWGIIANAYNGDWSQASPEWRQAAERWRDEHITRRAPASGK